MPPNARPPLALAQSVPPSAVSSANRVRCPKTLDERLRTIGSSTISKVPAMVRIISGRKRSASWGLKAGLASTGDLRANPQRRLERPRHRRRWSTNLHSIRHVHIGLLDDARGVLAYRRQEALRAHAHPHHHHDQRNDRRI